MIPHGVDVFVGLDPIDLRWGFERRSGLVVERLGRQVRGGALFLFFGRRRDTKAVRLMVRTFRRTGVARVLFGRFEDDVLNDDDAVHGILVQLRLPQQFNIHAVLHRISPGKDSRMDLERHQ